MKKLVAVALMSLAALACGVAPASAGWFGCRHCGKVGACATQYNAFSPYCVSGVYTSSHCHKCFHPAEGPCCGRGWGDLGWGGCADGACGAGCVAGGDGTPLGVLPAPAGATIVPNTQLAVPQAPTPVPSIPGATSQLMPPARMIQPLGYQPTMPAPAVPYYWNGN